MTDSPNPFFDAPKLAHGAYPFDQIRVEHYIPAIDRSLAEARTEIARIGQQADSPTFENTIEALECSDDSLEWVSSCFYGMKGAEGPEELHALAKDIEPKLAAYANDVALDAALFTRVKDLYDRRESLELTTEQDMVLDKHYKGFVRNGALLSETDKEKLRGIDEELSQLSPKFSQNILKQSNAYELHVTDESRLGGLPASSLNAGLAAAEEREKESGWVFTLDMPSFYPFMKFADDSELRKEIWTAFGSRGVGGEFDNSENVKRMATLRYQRAKLLGYADHASYTLEERMAGTPEQVDAFYTRLLAVVEPAARKDLDDVRAFKNATTGDDTLAPWDFSYWAEKLKQDRFDFDEELLRPYFKLENVVEGVFEHARRLFDLAFAENTELPKYHEDVTIYDISDATTGEFIGLFYTDFFPRPNKQTGAWMTPLKGQGLREGTNQRPHVMNVCNFTKPTRDTPSLLSLNEVETLFHEFGHALHGLLTQCTYRSVSGTNVYWDFVELPSQILENWLLEKESLDLFARHYETNEAIPGAYMEKIRASSCFLAGATALRQIFLGKLDMSFHRGDPSGIVDLAAHETAATEGTRLFDMVEGTAVSHAFLHIFAGGYSAGYYSYKWAEVLDADAFEYFKEKGIFNRDVADAFRTHILSKGGSENPMELYKRFRGREPDPEALLRRDGLLPA